MSDDLTLEELENWAACRLDVIRQAQRNEGHLTTK
jgi:hypothetical protein